MTWIRNVALLILLLTLTGIAKSQVDGSFFDEADSFLKKYVQNKLIDYQAAAGDPHLQSLINRIGSANLEKVNSNGKQAFYINAYNLIVIYSATKAYPTKSVLKVNGFFDGQKHLVAGEKITLNQLEKERLFKLKEDARFHFVLVCGALGCPPLANYAYTPNQLESQLEARTIRALNDPDFIRVKRKAVQLSKIFKWYAKDFGTTNNAMIEFINNFRTQKIPDGTKLEYYEYDWTINDTSIGSSGFINTHGHSENRYVVSKALQKETVEIKWFNNLYTQRIDENRSSF
jgi:hypothetical protein